MGSTKILVALLCITSVEPSKGNGKGEKASENSGLREIAAKIEKIETAIGAGADVIRTGSSVASVAEEFTNAPFSVKFKLDFENHTDQTLWLSEADVNYGHLQSPADTIPPKSREAAIGHKTGNTATGCSGTMVWQIGKGRTKCFVRLMYSVPYNQNWHSNHLAVGISQYWYKNEDKNDLFNLMYNGSGDFKRGEFFGTVEGISFKKGKYTIKGSMGTSHRPIIKIQLYEDN